MIAFTIPSDLVYGLAFVFFAAIAAGADLLAMGVASFGHLKGIHYQNQHDVGPYMMEVDGDRLPIYRAYETDDDERLVREINLYWLELRVLG